MSALSFQRWPNLKMFLFYSYLKSTLSTLRELHFITISFSFFDTRKKDRAGKNILHILKLLLFLEEFQPQYS